MGLHLSRLWTVCLATLLFLGGCAWLSARPQPVLPAEELYRLGEQDLAQSRYASDALAKIDICRGRLAQKELFIAHYYYDQQDNTAAARQRLEGILRNYQHTLVIPETLFLLAEVNFREARTAEAGALFRRLAAEYAYTEWGKRAAQRLS